MKHFKPILFLCGIILSTAFGCEKNEDQKSIYWELPANSEEKAIVNTIDSIEYKFCLLNEAGIPTTSFLVGENFSFYLSLTNKGNDSLYLNNSFLLNKQLCNVFSESKSIIGSPFTFKVSDLVGPGAHPFYGKNKQYELTIPWNDSREEWQSLHCYFESNHKGFLPKGKYYTQFSQKFCFVRSAHRTDLCSDSITFKINFEIK